MKKFILCALLSLSVNVTANAEEKNTAAVLAEGISAFVTSSQETNSQFRATARLDFLRGHLTDKLLNQSGPSIKLDFDPVKFLCEPRSSYILTSTNSAFLATVAGLIKSRSTPAQTDTLAKSLAVLFKDHSIELPAKVDGKKISAEVLASCNAEAKVFPSVYYNPPPPDRIVKMNIVDGMTAINNFIVALNAIVGPLANLYDEANRTQAIINFLNQHGSDISRAVTDLAANSVQVADHRRQFALGKYLEAAAVLRAHEVKLEQNCNTSLSNYSSTQQELFMRCHAVAWKAISTEAASLLKLADEYDRFADASTKKIRADAANLNKAIVGFANWERPDDNFWAAVGRIIAFNETLLKALSKENRDKLQKAIDDLVKEF
jgi:hypothetical protein